MEKVKLVEAAGFGLLSLTFGSEASRARQSTKSYEFLVKVGLTHSDGIVALGGGVGGDLAGFVASLPCRGVHFVQILPV